MSLRRKRGMKENGETFGRTGKELPDRKQKNEEECEQRDRLTNLYSF